MNSLFLGLSSGSRLLSLVPRISRSLSTAARPIPEPRDSIRTPEEFLKAIGRSCDTKLSIESWDEFWNQKGVNLKSAGVGVRDRRYILWCMEKYRHGLPIKEFAHEMKPKKTIRGRGPTVQNGKRIRSRRDKTKTNRRKSS